MNDDQPSGASSTDDSSEVERLRAENERLRNELAEGGSAERGGSRGRRVASVVMAVLGSILLVVSVLGIWTRNVVLDTDRYVETIAPLAEDSEVQDAIAGRLSSAVEDAADIESLAADALPEQAAFLAAPIAAGANNLIESAVDRVVRGDRFENAWVGLNRTAHQALVAALTGRDGEVLDLSDGQVVLKLQPLVEEVLSILDDQLGIDLLSIVPTDKLDVEFVLFDSSQLAAIQSEVSLMDDLAWGAVVLTVLLLVGSIAVATDRRRGVLRVGVGIAAGMLLVVVGMALGRELFLSNLPDVIERPLAVAATFDILTRFVLQAVRFLFVFGVVLALAAWVLGPGTLAGRVRGVWNTVLGRSSEAAGNRVDLGPVPAFCKRYLTGLRVGILVLAGLVLVAVDQPTGKTVVAVAAVSVVLIAIVQFLSGMAGSPGNSQVPPADFAAEGGTIAQSSGDRQPM